MAITIVPSLPITHIITANHSKPLVPLPPVLAHLIAAHPCNCARPYQVFKAGWIEYVLGCVACSEIVAEARTLGELENDFRHHLNAIADIPF